MSDRKMPPPFVMARGDTVRVTRRDDGEFEIVAMRPAKTVYAERILIDDEAWADEPEKQS